MVIIIIRLCLMWSVDYCQADIFLNAINSYKMLKVENMDEICSATLKSIEESPYPVKDNQKKNKVWPSMFYGSLVNYVIYVICHHRPMSIMLLILGFVRGYYFVLLRRQWICSRLTVLIKTTSMRKAEGFVSILKSWIAINVVMHFRLVNYWKDVKISTSFETYKIPFFMFVYGKKCITFFPQFFEIL